MTQLLELMPEGIIDILGWLTLVMIILFREKLFKVFNGKEKEHNPNFITIDAKLDSMNKKLDALDDIENAVVKLTTIVDERLPRK